MRFKTESMEQYDYPSEEYLDKVRGKYEPQIGRFLIDFSVLEHTLNVCIAELFIDDMHEHGYLIIAGNTLYGRIELFRKLLLSRLRYTRPKLTNRLKALVKRLHETRVFRNYLVHANWSTLKNTGYVRTRFDEQDGQVVLKNVRIKPATIKAWSNRVRKLDLDLFEFAEVANSA